MSESTYQYAHLRANVPKRRTGYKLFIAFVIGVFIVSLVDMIWLDDLLFWGVIAAYIIMFVWAVILLFSRGYGDESEDPWHLGEAMLHCPHCQNQFKYAADHTNDPHGARITCPICAEVSALPPQGSAPTVKPLATGNAMESAYECQNCDEHFMVSTFGTKPKRVAFETCPHCQHEGTVHAVSAPEKVDRRAVQDWTSS